MIPEAHLTAFAFGDTEHLSPDALKAVHDVYETDADVRAEIDAIRSTISLVGSNWENELQSTAPLSIAQSQENAPTESLKFPGFFHRVGKRGLWLPTGLAAAAAIALGVVLIPPMLEQPLSGEQFGYQSTQEPIANDLAETNRAKKGADPFSASDSGTSRTTVSIPNEGKLLLNGQRYVGGVIIDEEESEAGDPILARSRNLKRLLRENVEKGSAPFSDPELDLAQLGKDSTSEGPFYPGLSTDPTGYLMLSESGAKKNDAPGINASRTSSLKPALSAKQEKVQQEKVPGTVLSVDAAGSAPKSDWEATGESLATITDQSVRYAKPALSASESAFDPQYAGRQMGRTNARGGIAGESQGLPGQTPQDAFFADGDVAFGTGYGLSQLDDNTPKQESAPATPALTAGAMVAPIPATIAPARTAGQNTAGQDASRNRGSDFALGDTLKTPETHRFYFQEQLDASRLAEQQGRYDDALGLTQQAYGYVQQNKDQFGLTESKEIEELVKRRSVALNAKVAEAERYAALVDQPFHRPTEQALSTFSIDVDTASYANARRFIENGALPPKDSVRIEEFINAFDYRYAETVVDKVTGDTPPFTSAIETASCPWNENHRLMRIGIKGVEVDPGDRPVANLVFLIDVSGSMRDSNKLALVKKGLVMLTESLNPSDRVSIVTYASGTSVALPSTSANEPGKIIDTINNLSAGGSTNGAGGLELAYAEARKQSAPGMINRVILCTDGDFNVGQSSTEGLTDMVKQNANTPNGDNITVSVFGFGTGNLNDTMLESITNNGNGIYSYIPDEQEAQTQFVEGLTGQLFTIAKDVKVQVEFNPTQVAGYRLIGYANRMLKAEDFNNDRVDAGDIGAGHTVTALYEVIPAGLSVPGPDGGTVDPLRYRKRTAEQIIENELLTEAAASNELALVKVRYKHPDAKAEPGTSKLLTFPVETTDTSWADATPDFRFAAAIAAFGETLRESPNRGSANLDLVLTLASQDAIADDQNRQGFRQLVEKAQQITGTRSVSNE